jgi:hypothetical protein
MTIQKNRSAEPVSRSEFDAILQTWYQGTEEDTVGGSVRYGGTPWLWVRYKGDLFHLNADTSRAGVREYLRLISSHTDLPWTVVEGRSGRRTKVLFGSDYWRGLLDWIEKTMLAEGLISPEDLNLLIVTDSLDEVCQVMVDCYNNRCWETWKRSEGARLDADPPGAPGTAPDAKKADAE